MTTLLEKYKIDPETGARLDGNPTYGDTVRYIYYNDLTGKTTIIDKLYDYVPPPPITKTLVFVHVEVLGGDGQSPIGIKCDGTHTLTLKFTLRENEAVESETKTAVNRSWLVKLRDEDGGLYDYLNVQFINGVATAQYTTDKVGVVSILREDVNDIISGAEVVLVTSEHTSPAFRAYNDMTGA